MDRGQPARPPDREQPLPPPRDLLADLRERLARLPANHPSALDYGGRSGRRSETHPGRPGAEAAGGTEPERGRAERGRAERGRAERGEEGPGAGPALTGWLAARRAGATDGAGRGVGPDRPDLLERVARLDRAVGERRRGGGAGRDMSLGPPGRRGGGFRPWFADADIPWFADAEHERPPDADPKPR